jgi:hypothetical protein
VWKRSKRGEVVARLNDVEAAVLASLLDELDELAVDPDLADDVAARLYPAGYQDDREAADFRELTQSSLATERRQRYRGCRDDLPTGAGQIVIAAESSERWLAVLNDMRLALGTRLGVASDGFADGTDGGDQTHPDFAGRAAYYWLTAVQDDLLGAVMD